MKYFLLVIFIIILQSCQEDKYIPKKWVLNNIHSGIVMGGYRNDASLVILDSGITHYEHIDPNIWDRINTGDTIINFK